MTAGWRQGAHGLSASQADSSGRGSDTTSSCATTARSLVPPWKRHATSPGRIMRRNALDASSRTPSQVKVPSALACASRSAALMAGPPMRHVGPGLSFMHLRFA